MPPNQSDKEESDDYSDSAALHPKSLKVKFLSKRQIRHIVANKV